MSRHFKIILKLFSYFLKISFITAQTFFMFTSQFDEETKNGGGKFYRKYTYENVV